VANRVFAIRLLQWLGWFFETQERKKQRKTFVEHTHTHKRTYIYSEKGGKTTKFVLQYHHVYSFKSQTIHTTLVCGRTFAFAWSMQMCDICISSTCQLDKGFYWRAQ